MDIDKILEDIKKFGCITMDGNIYSIYSKKDKVNYTIPSDIIHKLVDDNKVKLVEQARTYRVDVI